MGTIRRVRATGEKVSTTCARPDAQPHRATRGRAGRPIGKPHAVRWWRGLARFAAGTARCERMASAAHTRPELRRGHFVVPAFGSPCLFNARCGPVPIAAYQRERGSGVVGA